MINIPKNASIYIAGRAKTSPTPISLWVVKKINFIKEKGGGMNAIDKLLVVENDRHCPCCRMWYLTPFHDTEPQDDLPGWVDTWERRGCGEKRQSINIEIGECYDLSEWTWEPSKETSARATDAFLMIKIDKSEDCPDNIKFFITFFENYEDLDDYVVQFVRDTLMDDLCDYFGEPKYENFNERKNSIEQLQSLDIRDGYYLKETGAFLISLKLEEGEEICLNEMCPLLEPEVWFKKDV